MACESHTLLLGLVGQHRASDDVTNGENGFDVGLVVRVRLNLIAECYNAAFNSKPFTHTCNGSHLHTGSISGSLVSLTLRARDIWTDLSTAHFQTEGFTPLGCVSTPLSTLQYTHPRSAV